VAMTLLTLSIRLTHAYGLTSDGGLGLTMIEYCTCSGGSLYETYSYVDMSPHIYLDYPGETIEYSYYSFEEDDLPAYFLANIDPFAICLMEEGEYCDEEEQPEGTLSQLGDSAGLND